MRKSRAKPKPIELPKKKKVGNPAFKVTEEDRASVIRLVALGITHEQICLILKFSKPVLYRYFRRELDIGMSYGNSMVGNALFKKATTGGSVPAMVFWLKTRAGWTEKQSVEIMGPNGGPLQSITTETKDPVEAARIYQKMMNGE